MPVWFEPSNLDITDPKDPDFANAALNWRVVKVSSASI